MNILRQVDLTAARPLNSGPDVFALEILMTLARASVAAHVVGADCLAAALNEFQPSGELEAYLDAAEIAHACRRADALQALWFRPWARTALSDAAFVLEAAGAVADLAGALANIASPEVAHAHA